MKLGCCVNMLASTDTKVGDENIPYFCELGYDFIELPLAPIMDLPDAAFAELRRRVGSYQLPVEVCNNFFPANMRLTGPDYSLKKVLEYVRLATERAAELGAQIIVFGSADARNVPPGYSHAQAREQLITLLHGIQDIVSPIGITVALEAINAREGNFIRKVREAFSVMKEAACDDIKLLADYYHMRMENECFDVLGQAGEDLRHIHIAAKARRAFPQRNDGEDYAAFFARLKAIGYDARISVEGRSEDIPADGKEAALTLRPYM